MYCPTCELERASHAKYCGDCGGGLRRRAVGELSEAHLRANLVLLEVRRWVSQGRLEQKAAELLLAPLVAERAAIRVELGLEPAPTLPAPTEVVALQPVRFQAAAPQAAPATAPDAAREPGIDAAAVAARESELAIGVQDSEEPDERRASSPPVAAPPFAGPVAPALGAGDAVELAPPEPELTGDDAIVAAESSWTAPLRSFLHERIGWFVGGFLVVAGSCYFVAESWSALSGGAQQLLVLALLCVYGGAFGLLGRWLGDRRGLPAAGRTLLAIGGALGPVAAVAAGELRSVGPLAAGAAAAGVAALFAPLVASAARRFGSHAGAAGAFGALAFLAIGVGPSLSLQPAGVLALDGALLLAAWGASLAAGPHREGALRGPLALGAAYLLAATAIRLHFVPAVAPSLAAYGALAALALALGLDADARGRAAVGPGGVAAPLPLTLGRILAFASLVPALLVAAAAPAAISVACAAAAIATAAATTRHRRPAFAVAAVGLGLVAYQLSPALVPAAAMRLYEAVRASLGYAGSQPLPGHFLALTSIPYLPAVGFLAARAKQAGALHAKVLARAACALALVLLGWSQLGADARPGLWVGLAVAALALVAERVFDRGSSRLAAGVGALGLLGAAVGARAQLGLSPESLGLALSAAGLLAFVAFELARKGGLPTEKTWRVGATGLLAAALPFLIVAEAGAPRSIAGAGVAFALGLLLAKRANSVAAAQLGAASAGDLVCHLGVAFGFVGLELPLGVVAAGTLLIAAGPVAGTLVGRALRRTGLGLVTAGAALAVFQPGVPGRSLALGVAAAALLLVTLRDGFRGAAGATVPLLAAAAALALEPLGLGWLAPAILGLLAVAAAATSLLAPELRAAGPGSVAGREEQRPAPGSSSTAPTSTAAGDSAGRGRELALAGTLLAACSAAAALLELLAPEPPGLLQLLEGQPGVLVARLVAVGSAALALLIVARRGASRPLAAAGCSLAALLPLAAGLPTAAGLAAGAALLGLFAAADGALGLPSRTVALGRRLLRRDLALPFHLLATAGLVAALVAPAPVAASSLALLALGHLLLARALRSKGVLAAAGALATATLPVLFPAQLVVAALLVATFVAALALAARALPDAARVVTGLRAGVAAPALGLAPLCVALFAPVAAALLGWLGPSESPLLLPAGAELEATPFPSVAALAALTLLALARLGSSWARTSNHGPMAGGQGAGRSQGPGLAASFRHAAGPGFAYALLALGTGVPEPLAPLAVAAACLALVVLAAALRRHPAVAARQLGTHLAPEVVGLAGAVVLGLWAVTAAAAGVPLAPSTSLLLALAALPFAAAAVLRPSAALGWPAGVLAAAALFATAGDDPLSWHRAAVLSAHGLLGLGALLRSAASAGFLAQLAALGNRRGELPQAARLDLAPAVLGKLLACVGLLAPFVICTAHLFGADATLPRWFAVALAATLGPHLLLARARGLGLHHLLLTFAAALGLFAGHDQLPYLTGAAAVALAALAALAATRPAGGLAARAAAPLAGHGIALALWGSFAAGLSLSDAGLFAALLALTVALAVRSGSTGKRAWLLLALVAAPLAAHAGVAWIGRLIAVGRPEVTVLVGFAPALALLALCADLLASRLRAVDPRSASSRAAGALRGAAELYGVLGATYSILALLAVHDFTLREALLLAAAPLLLCAAAARRAIREGSAAAAFGSELFLLLLWLCLRIAGPLGGDLGPLGSDADALAGVLLGLAFLGLRALVARGAASSDAQQAFQRPALVAAHLFPLLGLVGVLTGSAAHPSAALGLAAVHFAALAAQSRGKLAAVVGALCLDAALFVAFHSHGFSDPQLYGIPAGLTLVLLARLFATDLGPEQAARLRALGAVVLYAASSYRALIFADPIYPLVTAGLCVLGVALGISLRIRAWLYVGTTFLVVDVAGNAIRHGLADHRIGALALTLLGLLVVGFMIFFTARREELLQRVRAYQLLIRSWS